MSEHQCYEFVALDRPLTNTQMAELRAISTRAEIGPTRFRTEYQWGDLKANSVKLMERYFDAHMYFANWGTRRLMLRIPTSRVDQKALEPYFVGKQAARLTRTGQHVLLDLGSDTEAPEYDDQHQRSLAALSPLRAELMQGDLRPAYLAWLVAVSAHEVAAAAEEPPVPAGLAALTPAQQAMVEFLRIDVDLVSAAAKGSAAATEDGAPFHRWLAALPTKEKDAWLKRAADELDLALGAELLRAFRATTKAEHVGTRRTVMELRAQAQAHRVTREKAEAARAKKAKAAADAARERHLTMLAGDIEGAWSRFEKLVEASDYDVALKLALDLRDLAIREAATPVFARRFEALRKRQLRRRGFFDRWKRARESDPEER